MEVILLEKVENLGGLGDQVKVRPGYGRNYLLPSGKAAPATPENVARFEEQRAELERLAQEKLAAAEKRREAVDGKSVTIKAKSGPAVQTITFTMQGANQAQVTITVEGQTVKGIMQRVVPPRSSGPCQSPQPPPMP